METSRNALQQMSGQIDALFDLGKKGEGEALLDRALSESAADPAYHLFFEAEKAGYLARDRKKQKELLLQAERIDPEDPFLLKNLGVFFLLNDSERRAIKCFDRVIELEPNDHEAYRHKGLAFSNLGRERKGMEWFSLAIIMNGSDYDAMRQTGVSLSKLGKDREAIPWFRKALAVNENDYDAMRQLGISLAMLGQYDAAVQWLNLALTVHPNDFETKRNLKLVQKKRNGEGETILNRLLNYIGRKVYYAWRRLIDQL